VQSSGLFQTAAGFRLQNVELSGKKQEGTEMNMTGIEARNSVDQKMKKFLCENHGQTGTIHMPYCFARSLAKCGESELPELSGIFFNRDIDVLEEVGYRGWPVVIEPGDGECWIMPNPSQNRENV